MRVFLGSDHAGVKLARELEGFLRHLGFSVETILSEHKCDYPDIAHELCMRLLSYNVGDRKVEGTSKLDEGKRTSRNIKGIGILICGTGIGMSISANRIAHIRAALCLNECMASFARLHNNANVLCLGERIIGFELAKSIVKEFLQTDFEGQRHQKRIEKVDLITTKITSIETNKKPRKFYTKNKDFKYKNLSNKVKKDY